MVGKLFRRQERQRNQTFFQASVTEVIKKMGIKIEGKKKRSLEGRVRQETGRRLHSDAEFEMMIGYPKGNTEQAAGKARTQLKIKMSSISITRAVRNSISGKQRS